MKDYYKVIKKKKLKTIRLNNVLKLLLFIKNWIKKYGLAL